MFKKFILSMMATFAIGFGFISCANDDDDNNSVAVSPVNADTKSQAEKDKKSGEETQKKNAEYNIEATLSCWVKAMGGQEFGKPVFKGAKIVENADGTCKVVLSLGKGTGNIYGINFDAFIDPRNSKPGYYNEKGEKLDAEYTVSDTDTAQANTGLDKDGNRVLEDVHYVTSMTFPVSKEKSEYNLWVYVNSNMMGVQFCDGKGEASSNHPNEATPYVGKLTIDWNSVYYGTYTGSMTVTMGGKETTTPLSITVAKDSVNLGERYGEYTKVLWLKDSEGKTVQAAQSDSTNSKKGDLTAENYTTASSDYIAFNNDGTAVITMPAMAKMGGTANLTKSK